jgi:uncharacterized protein YrrD
MLKAGDVIGRIITAREEGRSTGRIKDLVVDPSGREVMALVLSDGMFSGSRVTPWGAVQAFGPDSVIIDTVESVVGASSLPEIKAVLTKRTRIKGLKLLTLKGKELGRIADLVFDESTGDVLGYELSSDLFVDDFDGTPFLPTPQWIEMGKDVAFVAAEVEETIGPSGARQAPEAASG